MGGIPTGLTQNVGDFLKSEEIEGILGNSDFVYLLNQNAKDQNILAASWAVGETAHARHQFRAGKRSDTV